MAEQDIIIGTRNGVGWITLNRPEVLNALTRDMKARLGDAVRALAQDPDVDVIVLTGAGDRAFCVGSDLREMREFQAGEAAEMLRAELDMYAAVRQVSKPTIAAVNGYALGAGCILGFSCDFSIVAQNAEVGLPEVTVGLTSPLYTALLPTLVGLARARELVLLGGTIPASQAVQIGLFTRLSSDLRADVEQLINEIREISRHSFALQKRMVNSWLDLGFPAAIELSLHMTSLSFDSGEPQKGIDAFLQRKRKPEL